MFIEIDINLDQEMARKSASALLANSHQVVYLDASGYNNYLETATVILDYNQNIVISCKTAIDLTTY